MCDRWGCGLQLCGFQRCSFQWAVFRGAGFGRRCYVEFLRTAVLSSAGGATGVTSTVGSEFGRRRYGHYFGGAVSSGAVFGRAVFGSAVSDGAVFGGAVLGSAVVSGAVFRLLLPSPSPLSSVLALSCQPPQVLLWHGGLRPSSEVQSSAAQPSAESVVSPVEGPAV